MGQIQISPRHSDVKTLSIDILKRNALSVKFKVKLYGIGYNNQPTYYHQEYVYNVNKQANINMNLNLQPFIQISINSENGKESYIMNEVARNKFIRKSSKIVGLLEAYDSDDIDILTVDSSGTHIMQCFMNDAKVSIKFNSYNIYMELVIREDLNDVGVFIKINDIGVILSTYDFFDFIYKIRSLNFLSTALNLVTYFGSPKLGENMTDLRNDVPIRYDSGEEINGGGSSVSDDFSDLKKINKANNKSSKLQW